MPSAYQGTVLSARSRRLRTIGIFLIVVVISLTVYGMTKLMPPINHAAAKLAQQEAVSQSSGGSNGGAVFTQKTRDLTSAPHRLKVTVAVAYAYWGVCTLLLLTILFVAWLDLREISKDDLNQRRAIWSETADLSGHEIRVRGPSSE